MSQNEEIKELHIKVENGIKKLYEDYFLENSIDSTTGKLKGGNLKFATYPFIGSNYGNGNIPKILFIGLDIGRDESTNKILGFDEKRFVVEGLYSDIRKMNPHIAGLVISIIFCLRDSVFGESWRSIRRAKGYKEGIEIFKGGSNINLLSYIGLINLFKFVTPARINRLGGENRKHVFIDRETRLLFEEINIFSPEIIVFQSLVFMKSPYINLIKDLSKKIDARLIIGAHPSYRGRRTPAAYSKTLKEL